MSNEHKPESGAVFQTEQETRVIYKQDGNDVYYTRPPLRSILRKPVSEFEEWLKHATRIR